MSMTRSGSISSGIRLAEVRISAGSLSATLRGRKSTTISCALAISSLIRRSTVAPRSADIAGNGKSSRPFIGSMLPPVTGIE